MRAGSAGSRTQSVAAGFASFLIAFVIFWAPAAIRQWREVPLGLDSDAYVDIAVQVARGRGLQENRADPAYSALFQSDPLAPVPDPAGASVPSTRWPPLWPIAMGGIFKWWAYSLSAARTANCLFMAAACGLVAAFMTRYRGLGPALIFVALFAVIDERTRANARVLMTEPLATLLICLSAFLLIQFARSKRTALVLTAGLTIGLAALARSAVFLWLPGLLLLVLLLARSFGKVSTWRSIATAGLFTVTTFMTCAPWFVHNVTSLRAFMPLGSHSYTLPSGFSDQAWANRGVWSSLGPAFFASVDNPSDPPLVRARNRAEYGSRKAIDWIKAHPVKAFLLGVMKATKLWIPTPSIEMLYLLFPMAGLLVLRRSPESAVIVTFLLLNTLAVAATWIWESDRFQVPLLGLLHYAGAVGIWHFARGMIPGVSARPDPKAN